MIPIIVAIAVSTSAGIAAKRRYPERAITLSRRSLLFVLYVILPPTTFFNLAAVDFDAESRRRDLRSAGSPPLPRPRWRA